MLFSFTMASQSLFINNENYPSTETLELTRNVFEKVEISIAKKPDGSGIILITDNGHGQDKIKGKLIIYLEDQTLISCIDRGIYDSVNYSISTAYFLSKNELLKLTNVNISSIRYTVRYSVGYSENRSAENGRKGSDFIPKINFPEHIYKLIN